jgi:hypothetical protein
MRRAGLYDRPAPTSPNFATIGCLYELEGCSLQKDSEMSVRKAVLLPFAGFFALTTVAMTGANAASIDGEFNACAR